MGLKSRVGRALRLPGRWALEGLVAGAARVRPSAPAPPAAPASIFVLRNNDIGDLLVVTPLFDALRRRFPEARIVAGVGSWNLETLRHNPHVSEVLAVDAPWFNKYAPDHGAWRRLLFAMRSPASAELARYHFDVGIDVLGSPWGALLLLRAGIPYRLGVEGYAGGHRGVQARVPFDPGEHVGRMALRFAELLGAADLPPVRPQIFLSPAERDAGERAWAGRPAGRRLIVGPGGGLDVKCWPPGHFAELLRELTATAGADVLVLGGPREAGLVAELTAACPGTWSLPRPPGLRETFALTAAADGVICNSSMLMHVAAAFARPTVVLLGESFPSARLHQAQWGYLETCWSLGREPGERTGIATPAEALEAVRRHLEAAR